MFLKAPLSLCCSQTYRTISNSLKCCLQMFDKSTDSINFSTTKPPPPDEQTALARLFTSPSLEADWFAPSFLKEVPLDQVEAILTRLKSSLGKYQKVEMVKSHYYQVVFDEGRVATQISLDDTPKGQIVGLFFEPPTYNAISLEEAVARFHTFTCQASFLAVLVKSAADDGDDENQAADVTNPVELASFQPDTSLAVGSAFKLAVLAALRQQIESVPSSSPGEQDTELAATVATNDKKSWADVVPLRPECKSLPSGILQTWNDGSLLTLQTLATLMISLSDNTAADTLVRLVGPEAMALMSPQNRPFLTTRELFTLKSRPNIKLLQRYQEAKSETERLQILRDEIGPMDLPDVADLANITDPTAISTVEWFFTSRELYTLMALVADLALMSINPGVAKAEDWSHIAYKGGSEAGVLNVSTWLQSKHGQTYFITATWNDETKSLDEDELLAFYGSILEGLKK